MKTVKMVCDCCKKKFTTEHYEGGYIDHYTNFARRFDSIIQKKAEEIFDEICYEGNELRDDDDIRCRFKCFKKYCEQNYCSEKFEKVNILFGKHLQKLQKLDKIHDNIVDMVEEFDEFEREYIGLQYQTFMSKRLK